MKRGCFTRNVTKRQKAQLMMTHKNEIKYCRDCKVHYIVTTTGESFHADCTEKHSQQVTFAVRDILATIEQMSRKASKEALAIEIYIVLQANTWFLRMHPRFAHTVIKKVNEFVMCDEEHTQRDFVQRLYNYVLMNCQCQYIPPFAIIKTSDLI